MPNSPISGLTPATQIQASDLLVMEQTGIAKSVSGQLLENWLLSFGAGMGGIQSISKTSSSGTNPVVDTYTITYSNSTRTDTFTVTNGVKGDPGDNWYVYIRYSPTMPTPGTPTGDLSQSPEAYIGIASTNSSSVPATSDGFNWYLWKGNPPTLVSWAVDYQSGVTGTVVPSGAWSSTPPIVSPGEYLWTRTTMTFDTGSPVVSYSVGRQGEDGTGAAGSITPLVDIAGGAVGTAVAFAREDHRHPVPTLHIQASITALPTTISNADILSTMRVINCEFGTPSAMTSDLAWATSDNSLALSGTLATGKTTTVDIDLAVF